MILILYINKKNFKTSNTKLIGLLLIWASFTNFMDAIPSMGRFHQLTYPLLVYLWYKNWDHMNRLRGLLYFVPVAFGYKILYWFRAVISISEIDTYIFPFPIIFIKDLIL